MKNIFTKKSDTVLGSVTHTHTHTHTHTQEI
jgi:hypothetical protein